MTSLRKNTLKKKLFFQSITPITPEITCEEIAEVFPELLRLFANGFVIIRDCPLDLIFF